MLEENKNIYGMNVDDLSGYQLNDNNKEHLGTKTQIEVVTTTPITESTEESQKAASDFFDFLTEKMFTLINELDLSFYWMYKMVRILSQEVILNMFCIRSIELNNLQKTGVPFIPKNYEWQKLDEDLGEEERECVAKLRTIFIENWKKDKVSFLSAADILRQHESNIIENIISDYSEILTEEIEKNDKLQKTVKTLRKQLKDLKKQQENKEAGLS